MPNATPAQSPADQLLDDLIARRQLITYKAAYEALIGPSPEPWHQNHAGRVVKIADCTKRATVEGLPVHLDALVVLSKNGEPSDAHFSAKPYTLAQWRSAFGGWSVIRPQEDQAGR